MAIYVVLAFEHDVDAKFFVRNTLKYNSVTTLGRDEEEIEASVRGVFKKPTQFCECTDGHKKGFTYGQRFGWWVCAACGRPAKAYARSGHAILGKNLLPGAVVEDCEWRTDATKDVWSFLIPSIKEEASANQE